MQLLDSISADLLLLFIQFIFLYILNQFFFTVFTKEIVCISIYFRSHCIWCSAQLTFITPVLQAMRMFIG